MTRNHKEQEYIDLLKIEKDHRRKVKYTVKLADIYYSENKNDEAIRLLQELLDKEQSISSVTRMTDIYKILGYSCLRKFDMDNAEEYLLKAVNIIPKRNKKQLSYLLEALGEVNTRKLDSKKGMEYYNRTLKIRKELKFKKGISETLNKIGVNYYHQCNYSKAIQYLNEALSILDEKEENKKQIAMTVNNLCLAYFKKGEYETALKYGIKALDYFKRTDNESSTGKVLNNIGLIYFEMSIYSEALQYQFRSLKIKEKTANKAVIANTLSNIGMIFTRIFNLDKALEFSEKALKLRENINDLKGIGSSYNDIGRIYDKMDNFDKGIEFLKKSIDIKKKLGMSSGVALSLENLGMIYFKQKDFDRAEEYLLESKRLSEELGEQKSIAGIYRNLSNLYFYENKYHEALVYIKRSHDIAKEFKLNDKLRDSFKLMAEIYSKKKNYKKSLHYFMKYSKVNENILSITKQQELNTILVKYENEKKEKESEIFKLKNIELVKLNKSLRISKEALKKSNTEKDKFFNIIAHDLKNPFSILYTTSELLSTFYDELTKKKQKEYIKTISVSTKHLLKLIENLLEWSRTQSGKKQMTISEFDLRDCLKQTLSILHLSAEFKNISIKNDIKKKIIIKADKNMIRTVLRNLLTNAIKFTKTKGIIRIYHEEDSKYLKLRITDNGIGIKKKDIKKLFLMDKHFVTNGTSNEKGTGLGLLLCKEFIEKHNGAMFVESKINKGSTFGFDIPH